MNRKGSISIFALLILLIVSMNASFLLYMGRIEFALSNFNTESLKANYILEDKINRFIYDDEKFDLYFRKIILNESRRRTLPKDWVWNLKLKEDNFVSGEFRILNEDKKIMITELQYKYKNIKSIHNIHNELINRFFEIKRPLIDENTLDEDREDLTDYLNLVEREVFDYDFKSIGTAEPKAYRYNLYDRGIILAEANRKVLYDDEDNRNKDIFRFSDEILLLNIRNRDKNNCSKAELILGESGNPNILKLNGVLYIEGDLIVNQNMNFEGIIVINRGSLTLADDLNMVLKGMIFYRGEDNLDLENIETIYDQKTSYIYGSYLPGFIDSKITLIKKF